MCLSMFEQMHVLEYVVLLCIFVSRRVFIEEQ